MTTVPCAHTLARREHPAPGSPPSAWRSRPPGRSGARPPGSSVSGPRSAQPKSPELLPGPCPCVPQPPPRPCSHGSAHLMLHEVTALSLSHGIVSRSRRSKEGTVVTGTLRDLYFRDADLRQGADVPCRLAGWRRSTCGWVCSEDAPPGSYQVALSAQVLMDGHLRRPPARDVQRALCTFTSEAI